MAQLLGLTVFFMVTQAGTEAALRDMKFKEEKRRQQQICDGITATEKQISGITKVLDTLASATELSEENKKTLFDLAQDAQAATETLKIKQDAFKFKAVLDIIANIVLIMVLAVMLFLKK